LIGTTANELRAIRICDPIFGLGGVIGEYR
jgi:hypothetical protein